MYDICSNNQMFKLVCILLGNIHSKVKVLLCSFLYLLTAIIASSCYLKAFKVSIATVFSLL